MKALKAHRRMQTQSQTERSHAENSMTYVLVIIVVVLFVCQLPALFSRVLWIVTPNKAQECGNYQLYMLPITNVLIVLNSAVNFIICVLFNQRFRYVLFGKVFKLRATQQVVIARAIAFEERAKGEPPVNDKRHYVCLSCHLHNNKSNVYNIQSGDRV